jgi:hypothetical protein
MNTKQEVAYLVRQAKWRWHAYLRLSQKRDRLFVKGAPLDEINSLMLGVDRELTKIEDKLVELGPFDKEVN